MFCPGNSLTKSREFPKDCVGSSSPHEGLRICIVGANEAIDFFDEVGGGVERAPTDSALSDEGEEALDLIEPGGIGGGEVNVPTRPACEPRSDFGMFVSGVVVDDKMDVELGRYIGFDVPQEGEELLMTMAGFALGDNRAVEHVEGSEQRDCAVALVVVGDAFDVAEPHGKHGLGTFEGLDLAFLIDAKHHCLVRRIEIKPNHVAQLLDKEGIGRKLEAAGAVRLQTEELEQAMDGALGDPSLFGDCAHAPMCCSFGFASECFGDQLGHGFILNGAGPATAHLVVEPFDPIGDEASAPFADRVGADTKPRRHDGVAWLALAGQHDLRSQRQRRGQRARPCQRQQMSAFIAGHREYRLRASGSHRVSPDQDTRSHAIIMLRTYGTKN